MFSMLDFVDLSLRIGVASLGRTFISRLYHILATNITQFCQLTPHIHPASHEVSFRQSIYSSQYR
jgi:hypothetical protein